MSDRWFARLLRRVSEPALLRAGLAASFIWPISKSNYKSVSKADSQRKLYNPCAAIPGSLSEECIDLFPGRVKSCRSIYRRPLWMVERVVELTTKLKLDALMESEILERSQVPLILARSPKDLARGIANVAQRGRREYAGIEEAATVPVSVS